MCLLLEYPATFFNEHIQLINELLKQMSPIRSDHKEMDILQPLVHKDNVDIFNILAELCPGLLQRAISLIDTNKINIYISKNSKRRFYTVDASQDRRTTYLVMKNFCSCHSYIENVINYKREFTCKHELACLLFSSLYIGYEHEEICIKEEACHCTLVPSNFNIYIISDYEFSRKLCIELNNIFLELNTFNDYILEDNDIIKTQ
ncbi:uncharacterized protein CMU_024230 [Cryptosporidium muris RN66]|uniref:SWIM-type domain-containing protein n=1 Tax=Cryptosporidium muris (strain RN66) TaxID=441375 RepID=B6AC65_CRYMR|nr:uncharacterized protein CMU_024230 [Cryptosporidium muris RN66]EEA05418.1 hypothetical protein, conserved [Cryptosporidium muris RN66]|eukprot:XP_002139767.1 hypothetical protein [Cryptosporidium muris RN66]